MVLSRLKIPGGLQADLTTYATGPRWETGNRVRFKQGQPEPIGGFEAYDTFDAELGTPSAVRIWRDLSENDLMAIGTEKRLHIIKDGITYDITPVESTANLSGAFAVSNADATVTVTDSSHNAVVGDYVVISGSAAVGGITPNGTFVVATVIDANNYTFEFTSNASSSASSGGGSSIVIKYLLATGISKPTPGLGWGADTWGSETWGTAASTTNVTLDADSWSLDTWGEDLIACRNNGKIYAWDASSGVNTRAAVLSNAPTTNRWIQVSLPDRHLVSFGAHDGSNSDPLNIRWSTQENNNTWAPSSTNTAVDQRLHLGDKLIASINSRGQMLVWTDEGLFGMVFSGDPFTFTFRHLASGCAPISRYSMIEQDGITYWMGEDNFHVFTGREQILQSPVRDAVYEDLNPDFLPLVTCGTNRRFSEAWWHYTSKDGTDFPDKYVTYNWSTQEWAMGSLGRVVWQDATGWQKFPFAFDSSGKFYYHEKGLSADGSPLNWYLESGSIEIPEAGEQLFHVDRLIPDIEEQTGDVTFTMFYKNWPSATEKTKSATITSSTTKINKRVRGRQLRLKYSSDAANSFAKIGDLRLDWRNDGSR